MDTRKDFFILETDPSGKILEVLHQPFGFLSGFSKGADLMQLVEEGSREKLSRLLSTLREQGVLANWEIFLHPENPDQPDQIFHLGGIHEQNRMLVFGGETPLSIRAAVEWLRRNPAGFSSDAFRRFEQFSATGSTAPNDQQTFDEMSRLYGELASMQRELAKKQVQLEQLNATISRYATSLEEMVAERTRQFQESEARFRGIFEFSSLGIAILDDRGGILSSNQALNSILGRISPGGVTVSVAEIFYPPAELDFNSLYQELITGTRSQVRFEVELVCFDGGRCWVEVNFFLVPLVGSDKPIAIHLVEDITARKENELALIQAEKLTTLGKIASSLAHEINNPLQAIMGNLDLASEGLMDDERTQRRLQIARDELQRVSRIVSELRSAGRKPMQRKKSPAGIDEVVDKVAALVRKQCEKKGIELIIRQAGSLPLVMMDQEQIEQVLLNLTVNAIEAVGTDGRIAVESRRCSAPNGVEVRVCNSGAAIPQTVKDHIFEPFFTTKEEGLGLGLHISRQIIESHGGLIELMAGKKQTCFRVFLPEQIQ
jgi:PAS domain S-box-containing protein